MTGRAVLALGLVVGGSLLTVPVIVVLGLAMLLLELIRAIWSRRGLDEVTYERRLATDRAVAGDAIPLSITVWNRKRLPLAWLTAEDKAPSTVRIRERTLRDDEDFGRTLLNTWTLAPFERVIRRFHLEVPRRGPVEIGPVRLTVGDLFAGTAAQAEVDSVDHLLVRPRTIPVAGLEPTARWGGDERARRGLLEQPLSYAGVRDYRPGDPVRRIHPRTSARLGRPMVKRFDPARERAVCLALDIQTLTGPAWQAAYDDDRVEELCVVVGSLARTLRDGGAAVGLAVAGYAGSPRPIAIVRPAEQAAQVARILDVLARLSPYPSATFDRLLGALPRTLRPGAEVIAVTARDPMPYLASMRRLRAMGYGVTLLALGPSAATATAQARSAGITAHTVVLDGTWATATGARVA